jgi:general secretion pathway protein B
MSYILDALKKSEQLRQRGAAPSLLAAQVTDAAPRQPALLLYGLAAAVLLVVGVAIGILRPWQAAAPAPQPVAVKPPEPVVPPTPPTTAPAPVSVGITINAERQSPVPAPAAPTAPPPAGDVLKVPVPAPAAPAQSVASKSATTPEKPASSPAPETPAGARPAGVVPERPVVTAGELPASIQQDIPKLSILFHLYSANPRDRLVGINDRMLHEGDAVEPGLVLEQVTPDGMILNYKGYRFLRGTR